MHRLGGKLEELITPDLVLEVTKRYLREHKRRRAVRRVARNRDAFVADLRADLLSGRYCPGNYHRRTIGGNGEKVRDILIPTVRDAIAASCLVEVFCKWTSARLYPHAYCNRRGFGGALLARRLSAFLVRTKPRYYVKFDVRKCFDSIRHDDVEEYVYSVTKCRRLAEVIIRLAIPAELIRQRRGIPIGNGLSHHMANGILSPIWYRARRLPGVTGLWAYMDDVVYTGNNKRKLQAAADQIGRWLACRGLSFKYPPAPCSLSEGVDLVGYRFWNDGRRRLRRKIYYRAARAARSNNPRRCAAYLGMAKIAHDVPLVRSLTRCIKKGRPQNDTH